jgi:hypothetical protein
VNSNTKIPLDTFDIRQALQLFTYLESKDYTIGDLLVDIKRIVHLRVNEGTNVDLDASVYKRLMVANYMAECKIVCKRVLDKANIQQYEKPQRPKNTTTMEYVLAKRKGTKK